MIRPDDAARSDALFVRHHELATLTVSGPDRALWLQGVLTCDVSGLAEPASTLDASQLPRLGRWGLVLSRQGKILSDVLVVGAPDVIHLGVPLRAMSRVQEWLSSFLVMEDADLDDRTSDFVWFGAHGPRGGELAARLAARFGGVAASVDPTGLGGAMLVVTRGREADVEAAVQEEPGVAIASDEDWLRLRVERLVPLFGADMDEQRNPHEASLDRRSVSWDKGCYLGQEAVCMLDMRGKVKRRLALVAVESGPAPAPGTPVTDAGGGAVGETRTGTESAVHGRGIAIALLSDSVASPGARLVVGGVPAVVVEPNR